MFESIFNLTEVVAYCYWVPNGDSDFKNKNLKGLKTTIAMAKSHLAKLVEGEKKHRDKQDELNELNRKLDGSETLDMKFNAELAVDCGLKVLLSDFNGQDNSYIKWRTAIKYISIAIKLFSKHLPKTSLAQCSDERGWDGKNNSIYKIRIKPLIRDLDRRLRSTDRSFYISEKYKPRKRDRKNSLKRTENGIGALAVEATTSTDTSETNKTMLLAGGCN